jgi:protein-disulfide isomerase
MHYLLKIYGDKVRLYFRNFPLDSTCNPELQRQIHPTACLAARASLCAQEQNKFDLLFEKFFSNQRILTRENINTWAQQFNLNMSEFESCLTSDRITVRIREDIALAKDLQVQSTPTFFVNGRKVEGVLDENRLKALLEFHMTQH